MPIPSDITLFCTCGEAMLSIIEDTTNKIVVLPCRVCAGPMTNEESFNKGFNAALRKISFTCGEQVKSIEVKKNLIIDNKTLVWEDGSITGEQLRTLGNVSDHTLIFQVRPGRVDKEIAPYMIVSLIGTEKFRTF